MIHSKTRILKHSEEYTKKELLKSMIEEMDMSEIEKFVHFNQIETTKGEKFVTATIELIDV